jgi:hypothetical protein
MLLDYPLMGELCRALCVIVKKRNRKMLGENFSSSNQSDFFSENLSNMSLGLLFLLMLYSMYPWFFWDADILFVSLLFSFVCIRLFLWKRRIQKEQVFLAVLVVMLYSVLDVPHLDTMKDVIRYLAYHVLLVLLVIFMRTDERILILPVVTKCYAFVLCLSISMFILCEFGMDIPYQILKYPHHNSYPDFQNRILLITRDTSEAYHRFQAIFREPGDMGISALLLYMNHYELKRKSIFIIFVSVVLSFSLAAYVLLLLGYITFDFAKVEGMNIYVRCIKWIVLFLLIIFSGMYVYNEFPQNIFGNLIVERLVPNEEKGINGNNRTSLTFDSYYESSFYKSNDKFFGMGYPRFQKRFPQGGVASWKGFVVMHGLVGIACLFFFFSYLVFVSRSRFVFGLFVLYCAYFWQRPYILFEMQLFLFISYCTRMRRELLPNTSLSRLFSQVWGKPPLRKSIENK